MEKALNPYGNIAKVIAVMSGKGGVGKSSVTAFAATALKNANNKVGILDADITGPSIPKLFGLQKRAQIKEEVIYPVETTSGIKVMSINLLLEREDDPVIWRGPILSNVVKQFYEEVHWGDLDYLLIDLPPGTGDVPLTVMQSLPLDGLLVVTTPQELVSMVVKKAIRMADQVGISVLGLIENMSYTSCPHCAENIALFGESHAEQVAEDMGIRLLGRLPMMPDIDKLADEGKIELVEKLYPEFFEEIKNGLAEKLMTVNN